MKFTWLGALTLLIGAMATGPVAHASAQREAVTDWRADGPSELILTYRVAPAARISFRELARTKLLPRLAALKTKGDLASYRVLMNRYVDSASWDMMVILDFASPSSLANWRRVEEVTPAGLPLEALTLVTQAEAAPGSMLREHKIAGKKGDPAPVYLVIPYDYLVSTDAYLDYVDGYVVPQMDGWVGAGALVGYGVYLPRYAAGRHWSALLLLAYRGDEGLAARDSTTKAVRAHLDATSPEWKAFAAAKGNIRVEKQPIVADELTP